MGDAAVVEYVAGPWCGRTETIDPRHGPIPPLSVAPAVQGGGPAAVYQRRDVDPDPLSGRWMFDHVPTLDT